MGYVECTVDEYDMLTEGTCRKHVGGSEMSNPLTDGTEDGFILARLLALFLHVCHHIRPPRLPFPRPCPPLPPHPALHLNHKADTLARPCLSEHHLKRD